MNIALNISDVMDRTYNIKILEKKRNNIFDGEFAKLVYSNENVTLNGLYIYIPLHLDKQHPDINIDILQTNNKWMNKSKPPFPMKNILYFQTNHPHNVQLIEQISLLEKQILDYYKEYMNISKTSLYTLHTQLISGSTKFYCDNHDHSSATTKNKHNYYIIKISGIWESATTIGITYKFIEVY